MRPLDWLANKLACLFVDPPGDALPPFQGGASSELDEGEDDTGFVPGGRL